MVCLSNEVPVQATIRDTIGTGQKHQSTIYLTPSKLVSTIFAEIAEEFHYEIDAIQLTVQTREHLIDLNEYKDSTLSATGLNFDPTERTNIIITPIKHAKNIIVTTETPPNSEDDLLLGASASPPATAATSSATIGCDVGSKMRLEQLGCCNVDVMQEEEEGGEQQQQQQSDALLPALDLPNNYVGLVNQAMTCYLNSLLQALYMTPEFRNALYNWEFDGVNETRSIPFQLQKLFLNLQTSHKIAVETTDLTKSFGWQSSEAWQQHDIQELCRVMFDALEQKFRDTQQAKFINDLYEGIMLDYVRCLECGTEKSREDKFMDIPLPVRSFDSKITYNSVDEALRAFVQPETLEGNNQYNCEKCNKMCDAHKGLKFIKFPYLLTLHLKRFDFDYNTMHRIKLNDKLTFPEILNLNAFVLNENEENDESPPDDRDAIVKCDDCSTTDSGSALDDESCAGVADGPSTVNGQDLNCQDEDEGIDMTIATQSQPQSTTTIQQESNNMKNANRGPSGPYLYELFSIMIHSGSASGGHYYAYIKDFNSGMWFCFNDQNVSSITEDDIKKTYGGCSSRGHYNSAYSPSTNAYMLMYRQIDKERNATPITVENFPPHIKKLLKQMKLKEEQERLIKEKENELIKTKVYCYHPVHQQLVDRLVLLFLDGELRSIVKDCLEHFELDGEVSPDDCRLVSYNKHQDTIICSFENDTLRLCDVMASFNNCNCDFLLEIKQPGTEWKEYKPGGVNMKVYTVNLETEEVDGPVNVRVNAGETVGEFKTTLAKLFDMNADTMKIVQETYSNQPKYLDEDEIPMKFDPNYSGYKIYVSDALDEDPDKSFMLSKLHKIIDQFVHVVSLTVVLPDTDSITLESLSIPPLDPNQNMDITCSKPEPSNAAATVTISTTTTTITITTTTTSTDRTTPSPRCSPQLMATTTTATCGSGAGGGGGGGEGFGDQSNSEDSSLSDSDRTLVGDAPGDCIALLSSSSDSAAGGGGVVVGGGGGGAVAGAAAVAGGDDERVASLPPPCDPTDDVFENPSDEVNWDDADNVEKAVDYYFRLKNSQNLMVEVDGTRCCKVMVDKRMNLARFKKCLEGIVGVPMEYFKIYRQYPNQDEEWSRLNDTLSSTKDGERLLVKLGRVLRKNEYIVKVFNLTPNNENGELFTFLFEQIIAKGQTVAQIRKEIVFQAKKQYMLDIPFAKSRLRKKSWKNPSKVYLDDQKFVDDITLTNNNSEIFIQQLPDNEKVTSTSQLVLFVRQWCPSTLTLKPFEEIVMDTTTVEELKRKIAEMSGIEEQYVEVACPKSGFPCDMNVLNIHSELDWNKTVTHLESWPWQVYDDGSVIFYRDSREPQKSLTAEERKELNQRESIRLGIHSVKNYSLSGRERALKIYLDNSPSKSDDAD